MIKQVCKANSTLMCWWEQDQGGRDGKQLVLMGVELKGEERKNEESFWELLERKFQGMRENYCWVRCDYKGRRQSFGNWYMNVECWSECKCTMKKWMAI